MAVATGRGVYTLHVFPFSLYSMLTRFTANLGALTDTKGTSPEIRLKLVNLHKFEQFSEEYLAMNPRGQVPCLSGPGLSHALCSSGEVCDWLCEQYPKLRPQQHKGVINDLVGKMRSFHAMAVSWPKGSPAIPNKAEELLKQEGLSQSYRKALEFKRDFHRENFDKAMDPPNVADTEAKAQQFVDGLLAVFKAHNGGSTWLFGDEVGPTVLDGHGAPFLARLLGSPERKDMVPDELKEYMSRIKPLPEWEAVFHGRSTMYDPSMGDVANIPL